MIDVLPWIGALPSALLILSALTIPGTILSVSFGIAPRRWVLSIPLLSIALVGGVPVIVAPLGIAWGWPVLLGALLLVASVGAVLRRLWQGTDFVLIPSFDFSRFKVGPTGILIATLALLASLFSAYSLMVAMRSPDRMPQTWDAVYHVNAVRWILEYGDGSTLHLSAVSNVAHVPGFYPAGWHDLVALGFTGDVVVASNMATLVCAVLLWPLGVGLLASTVFNERRWIFALAPFIAGAYTSFPERPASYGTLWPTLLAYTLVPFLVAAIIALFEPGVKDRWPLLGIVLCGTAGVAIVHPTGVLATLVIIIWALPWHLWAVWTRREHYGRSWRVFISVAVALLIGVFALISQTQAWKATTSFSDRGRTGDALPELWGALVDAQQSTQGYGNAQGTLPLLVLTLIGLIYCALRSEQRFLVLSWLAVVGLYIEVVTLWPPLRALAGPWYFDPVRLGAQIPLVAAPLATAAATWLLTSAGAALSQRFKALGLQRVTAALLLVSLAVFFVLSGRFGLDVGAQQMHNNYYQDPKEDGLNSLIFDEEVAMMKRAAHALPDDARILADPMNGSPLWFGLTGVDVMFMHVWPSHGQDIVDLARDFKRIDEDPSVCQRLHDEGIEYFYSDDHLYWPEKAEELQVSIALRDAVENYHVTDHFELIDQGGGASLWRISTCD